MGKINPNKLLENKRADDKEEIVTPEMPLFQSEEGKFLSTKKINPNKFTKSNHVDEKEEIVTPEMPLFQSDEGKFLSTKKINNAQKMQQIEQNQIEDNKENDQESPQMPRLNTYEAKVMLSTKKPSSFKKHLSPEKDTAKDDSF